MTEDVQYEQLDPNPTLTPPGEFRGDIDLSRLSGIPMGLSVEIGRTNMTVAETLELRVGSIVTLDRLAGEPVDLLANGTPIARGEVIVLDEKFGLHITELVGGQEIQASGSAAPDAVTDSSTEQAAPAS